MVADNVLERHPVVDVQHGASKICGYVNILALLSLPLVPSMLWPVLLLENSGVISLLTNNLAAHRQPHCSSKNSLFAINTSPIRPCISVRRLNYHMLGSMSREFLLKPGLPP